MIGGALVALLWKATGAEALTAIHPMLAGVSVSTLLILSVSIATGRVWPVPDHVLAAIEEAAATRSRRQK